MVFFWSLRPDCPWRIAVRTPEEFRETVRDLRSRGTIGELTGIEMVGDCPWLPEAVRESLPGWTGGIFRGAEEDAAAWWKRRCRERKKRERN